MYKVNEKVFCSDYGWGNVVFVHIQPENNWNIIVSFKSNMVRFKSNSTNNGNKLYTLSELRDIKLNELGI